MPYPLNTPASGANFFIFQLLDRLLGFFKKYMIISQAISESDNPGNHQGYFMPGFMRFDVISEFDPAIRGICQ